MDCVFDPTRPCGSRTRAEGRYTKDELNACAKAYGIKGYSKMNMDDLCEALKEKVKEQVGAGAGARKSSPKPKKASPKREEEKKSSPKPKKVSSPKGAGSPGRKSSPKPKREEKKSPKAKLEEEKNFIQLDQYEGKECSLLSKPYLAPADIIRRRRWVNQKVMASHGSNLTPDLLQALYEAYDYMFFGRTLSEALKKRKHTLNFAVGPGMTKTAGFCKYKSRECEIIIELSGPIVRGLFGKGEKTHVMGGLSCGDRLECIQLIFEHELVHALINAFCNEVMLAKPGEKKRPVKHPKLFKDIALHLFGHTEFSHDLLSGSGEEVAERKLKAEVIKGKLKKGDRILIRFRGGSEGKATVLTKPNPSKERVRVQIDGGKELPIPFLSIIRILEGEEAKEVKSAAPAAPDPDWKRKGLQPLMKAGISALVLFGPGEKKKMTVTKDAKPRDKAVRMMAEDGKEYLVSYQNIESTYHLQEERVPAAEGVIKEQERVRRIREQLRKGSKVEILWRSEGEDKGKIFSAELITAPQAKNERVRMQLSDGRVLMMPFEWIAKVL